MINYSGDTADKKNKIAAVVLTYHPGKEAVENVLEILKQVSTVYLVNNEFDAHAANILRVLHQEANVFFIDNSQNQGVACGFNAGIRKAFLDGFQYVVLFDQDSRPSVGMISALYRVHLENKDNVGVVGPALRDHSTGKFFDVKTGAKTQDLLISSGSLLSQSLIDEVGFLNEKYFIDYVDHEFCLRVKKIGKVNYIVNDVFLDHQFGEPVKAIFFGRAVTVSNYSPIRHFYMTRNRIFLVREYGFGSWFWPDFVHFLKMWAKVIIFERQKGKKILSFVRGFIDGIFGRYN